MGRGLAWECRRSRGSGHFHGGEPWVSLRFTHGISKGQGYALAESAAGSADRMVHGRAGHDADPFRACDQGRGAVRWRSWTEDTPGCERVSRWDLSTLNVRHGGFVRRSNTHLCKELPYCTYAVLPNPLCPGVRDLLGAAGVKEILREYAQDDTFVAVFKWRFLAAGTHGTSG